MLPRLSTAAAVVLSAGLLTTPASAQDGRPATAPDRPADPGAVPAPAGPAPAADPRDQVIEDLKKQVEQLLKRVEDLEKKVPVEAPAPAPQPEAETPPPPPTGQDVPTRAAGATYLPNISVVGNLIARGGDSKAIPGRGRSHFEELEIAFQDQVAPKLRYDLFINAEKEENWQVGMEEGYLTATGLLPGLNLRAGRMFTPIGKFNPQHPHQWLFITRPAASAALLGGHGLSSDGAVATYVLPTRGFYAGLDFGAWQTALFHADDEHDHDDGEHHHEAGFRAGRQGAYSTRLHLSKALSLTRELELGVTRYWGRGEVEGFGRKMQAINGLDLTYRSYPGAFSRLWLTAELLDHETRGIQGEAKHRLGGWLTAAYRWNQYWEAGIRGDYTRLPFPEDGYEIGGSLFLTKYLTEQTSLRLEYRHARSDEFGHGNGIFFQLLYGSGPHSHPLQ